MAMNPMPVTPVAEVDEDQHDALQDPHFSHRTSKDRVNDSPCDPYLNFDGMARESMEFHPPQTPTTGAGPRSMRSSRSLSTSVAESFETNATSFPPSLQTKGAADEVGLEPLQESEDEMDPRSFDLIAPVHQDKGTYSLERRSRLLFSKKHMGAILRKPHLLGQFTQFLSKTRPASMPLLTYYLEAEKALRAIRYANSVVAGFPKLEGHDFSAVAANETLNKSLQAKHDSAFEALTREELPIFITHVWIEIVSLSIRLRIVGSMPSHLRESSEGLAEVFCLTDPSRRDNPIILASDEFHRTTQYGMNYAIGRNCRFLQGPETNPFSIKRIRDRIAAGKEHYETFLNYRRDGSPFLNLLLCAPLIDSRGQVRYFLGAQVDVSNLAKECAGLDGLKEIIEEDDDDEEEVDKSNERTPVKGQRPAKSSAECCRELSEMFDRTELDAVRRHGGYIHQKGDDSEEVSTLASIADAHPYVVIEDGASPQPSPGEFTPTLEKQMNPSANGRSSTQDSPSNGRLAGVYENYLLVRPSSTMQVLFASPSLRVPGMLQSPFLSRIGGSGRVRNCIAQAFREGRGVTAKARWLSSARRSSSSQSDRGRLRWLHCTPLKGINNAIGIWMVVIVDEERSVMERDSMGSYAGGQRQKVVAPPIDDSQIRSTRTSYVESDRRTSGPGESGRGYTVRMTTKGPFTG